MGILDMLLGPVQSQSSPQDLSSMLGMDPKQLQALASQFGPSAEDKRAALKQSLLTAGLGILADRSGNPYRAIGAGGLLGAQSYNPTLQQLGQQRGQSIAQAMAALKAAKDTQMMDYGMNFLKGDGQQPTPAPQGNPSPMGGTSSLGPAFAAPQPAPQQSAPQSGAPSWANPRAEMAFGLMGNKNVADIIHRQYQVTQGPSGTLMRNGEIVGQVIPNVGIVVDGKLQPLPKEATQALTDFTKATTTATESAKAAFDLIPVPMPNGQTQMMTKADAVRLLSQGQPQGQTPRYAPNLSPQELAAAKSDFAQQGSGMKPGLGLTPDPLQMEAAKAAIGTQAAQNTKVADTFGGDYVDAVKAEKLAPATIQKYENLKNMWSKVHTGTMAPTVQSLKQIAAYVAPDAAKEWTADTPYYQAAQAMSNAMALELRNPAGGAGMPGSLSDSDRKYLQSMISSAQNDPRAIPMILDAKIALEKRNQDLGKIARTYRQQHGTVDEGMYQQFQDYADTHPLFPKETPAPQASGGKVVDFHSLPTSR